MSITILRHHGLRKVLIEYLQSQGIAELFSVLSAVISVNMLKGRYKASSGIPQVENTKFFLSGYKYFLCVDCPLYKGCNFCFMVFFTSFCCFAVSVCLVKVILCSYYTCLVWFCSADKMKSWFACSPLYFLFCVSFVFTS